LPADIQDRKGAEYVLYGKQVFLPELQNIYADGAYCGEDFIKRIYNNTGWHIIPVKRTMKKAFAPLAKRWIVERTLAWINKSRRMSKDYERLVQSSEEMIYLSMIRLMVKRLTTL
jgi:putative transposase